MSLTTVSNPQENYTILRIKRKRNEEPLDALVIETAKRKKSRGHTEGLNVFQFAETVEEGAWDDEKQKKDLETRISTLARTSAKKDVQPPSAHPAPPSEATTNPPLSQIPISPAKSTSTPERKPLSKLRARVEDPLRKYTIVSAQGSSSRPSESAEWTTRKRSKITTPPKVHSYKDLQKATFTMYDAIPSTKSLASLASPSPGATGATELDPDMDKFLPMLQDYLKISGDAALTPSSSTNSTAEDDVGYVWDIFYSRPASYGEVYGDSAKVIGSVTGLPDDDAQGSSDESEYEDEDDEDSNAEDWYMNDYPEDEDERSDDDDGSEGSDIFHEASDHEDVVYGRGRWNLEPEDD
ncbi:hypothetical protein PHLGIDRAFT_130582 [Phlebiopsis gigantea 11061_1 CR5-6]|uniref:Probable RNA polymerase II nuclear localization protein SLC7A6OS n=1 Tax=Phlebiopsis gigantea (strain 11061_1 CR5-6) TaxID=745531 RepID=A0A0C3RRI9_PHLG1|nr:hypothetical protein PHLGIDRAFT_130582 [Phlebiopsis gigantea 11061_1 CR5-6]